MRSTNSHLTIGTITATFIRQVSGALSIRMQDRATRSSAPELSAHLRYDIGDLDIRPQAEMRQAAHDLSLLRSL